MKLLAKIHVTLKPGVNDPQGLAIAGGLQSLGFRGLTGVRFGRYLEVQLDAESVVTAELAVDDMCRKLLANPVIETFQFDIEVAAAAAAK